MCFSCHKFCLVTTVPKKGYSRRCIPYELHACGMVYQRFLQKQAFLWRFLFNITKKKIEISIDHLYTHLLFSVSSLKEIKFILISLLNPFRGEIGKVSLSECNNRTTDIGQWVEMQSLKYGVIELYCNVNPHTI